ncbi:MAG: class II fructose-bisphosphate aldolase [Lachnospiraceae bacterium]|nr:class II fructose-bisphosphate aldolase [Lachnospiraceae bacterium]
MLVTLKEIMDLAEEKNIAIGSFNASGLEAIEAEITAAEELDLPVIIQFAQCHESWEPLKTIGPIMISMAKEARVPVCVHLDHGETLEYLEDALKIGFTGIMYDGSTLPYNENLENTKKAVAMARKYGASVEAELGSMGRRESGTGNEKSGNEDDTKIYTDPVLAKEFVDATGIDALACSFGTTHGIYLEEPKLDFSVVTEVRNNCNSIPVVMHGGSGVSKDDYKKAIKSGVRKINYFTYMDKAGGTAVADYIKQIGREPVYFSSIYMAARKAMKENVKEAMEVFALLK